MSGNLQFMYEVTRRNHGNTSIYDFVTYTINTNPNIVNSTTLNQLPKKTNNLGFLFPD